MQTRPIKLHPSSVSTTLDMSPYYIGYNNPQEYELAISNHKGDLNHGHYYSFVKNLIKTGYYIMTSTIRKLKVIRWIAKIYFQMMLTYCFIRKQ